jgi:hypothetical protein
MKFKLSLNLLDKFSKNPRLSNFTKIRPVNAEFFHSDKQTDKYPDMTKLRAALRSFANEPRNQKVVSPSQH